MYYDQGGTDNATYSLFDANQPSFNDNIPEINFNYLIASFRDNPKYYGVDIETVDARGAGTVQNAQQLKTHKDGQKNND